MEFTATLESNGGNATGIEVPAEVMAGLPGKRPPVTVTINGHTYRTSVGAMGGRSLIPVSAAVRAAAGVSAGQTLDVAVELDEAPREVAVPADLAAALAASPVAEAAFARLSFSAKQRHVLSVEDARTLQTRRRRIDKVVAELA